MAEEEEEEETGGKRSGVGFNKEMLFFGESILVCVKSVSCFFSLPEHSEHYQLVVPAIEHSLFVAVVYMDTQPLRKHTRVCC